MPSQFNILMSSASSEFDKLEFSNNPVPVLQPEGRVSSRIPGRIMGNYKVSRNTESTSSYTRSTESSVDNQLPIRVVRPVRLTDGKFAYELYGHRPNQSNYSCVNKTAQRQVAFPRSNCANICVGGPAGRYGNTARRILHRPWISTGQSASSNSSQAAGIHNSQSRPYLQTAIHQSEVSNPGSFLYKSRCRSQFCCLEQHCCIEEHLVINWMSSTLQQSNTPVRHQSASELLIEQSSSTPGYENRTPVEHSSSTPVERSSSTPGSDIESTIEHSSSTPIKFAKLDLDVLAMVLMEHLSNAKTADKGTQVPEKQLHRCFICGHKAMAFASHRQHMLSLHRVDVVGIAVVYDDNLDTSQRAEFR